MTSRRQHSLTPPVLSPIHTRPPYDRFATVAPWRCKTHSSCPLRKRNQSRFNSTPATTNSVALTRLSHTALAAPEHKDGGNILHARHNTAKQLALGHSSSPFRHPENFTLTSVPPHRASCVYNPPTVLHTVCTPLS